MGRWDDNESLTRREMIRDLVLATAPPKYGDRPTIGFIVPLRTPIETELKYEDGNNVQITGVFVGGNKSSEDYLFIDYGGRYTYESSDSKSVYNEVYKQLVQMKNDNALTMARAHDEVTPGHCYIKAYFFGSEHLYIDDFATKCQIETSKVASSINHQNGYVEYESKNYNFPEILDNILKTCRNLADRNIVLPTDDGRAKILFNGSRVNLEPSDYINISSRNGLEAMRLIAKWVDEKAEVNFPKSGRFIKELIEAVFSDQDLAKNFLYYYKNREIFAKIAASHLFYRKSESLNEDHLFFLNSYVSEYGGYFEGCRMLAEVVFSGYKGISSDEKFELALKILGVVKEYQKRQAAVSQKSEYTSYDESDVIRVDEGELKGEFVRIHGWTHDDPALLYSITDVLVYFYDTATNKVENIENDAGIDAYENRKGFFMIKAEDYVKAYEQLEAHDNAILEEIRAGHIVELKNFLEYALPQVGHSLDFKNEDVRVKYISVVGEQSKELKNLAHINGGFVMTGKDGYAVGIEHLTNGSAIRLLQQSREQLARDTIFARTTGPCNHFIEEELESLKHCTEHISEPAKKQEFLMKALDGLAKQFKAERISSEWIDDVREELQDLSKGIVRGEGLGRK